MQNKMVIMRCEQFQSHEIDLGAPLLAGDVLEAVIKDYERLGSDR